MEAPDDPEAPRKRRPSDLYRVEIHEPEEGQLEIHVEPETTRSAPEKPKRPAPRRTAEI